MSSHVMISAKVRLTVNELLMILPARVNFG